MNIRDKFPWWSKIIIKIILSRLPISYSTWQKLNIFRHGLMDEPDYAFEVFKRHYDAGSFNNKDVGFVMLELGPGDSLSSGIIAHYFGASKSYLVDKRNDVIHETTSYSSLLKYLNEHHDKQIAIQNISESTDIQITWNIIYLINGLDSLRELPESSIDFLWSQSVLEHIRKADFNEYVQEFRRIVSEKGVCAHGVDLKDHLTYSHNNLRISESLWESDFMSNSGFYTNRILYSEMLEIFRQNNFGVHTINIEKWDKIPTPREKLDKSFSNLPDDDLIISSFDVLLRPV